jgi:LPS-assembly protein
MAARVAARPRCRRLSFRRASAPILVVLCLGAGLAAGGASVWAQDAQLGQQWVGIPRQLPRPPAPDTPNPQMLLQADEINYDYNNERVVAVGHVQMYYKGSSVEAHRVVYDQKTKRLRAEGNVIIAQADGQLVHGEILDLNDDTAMASSIRCVWKLPTGLARGTARRAQQGHNHGLPERNLHRL